MNSRAQLSYENALNMLQGESVDVTAHPTVNIEVASWKCALCFVCALVFVGLLVKLSVDTASYSASQSAGKDSSSQEIWFCLYLGYCQTNTSAQRMALLHLEGRNCASSWMHLDNLLPSTSTFKQRATKWYQRFHQHHPLISDCALRSKSSCFWLTNWLPKRFTNNFLALRCYEGIPLQTKIS